MSRKLDTSRVNTARFRGCPADKVGALVAERLEAGITQITIAEEAGDITVCWPRQAEALEDQPGVA